MTLTSLIREIHAAGHEAELTIRVSEVNRCVVLSARRPGIAREVAVGDVDLHSAVDPELILSHHVADVLHAVRYNQEPPR
jgi:hypothetical protein